MFTTLLFAPGDSERKMMKALSGGADLVILDMEDSVSAANKEEARQVTANVLKATTSENVLRYVRVNPFETEMTEADIAAVLPHKPDGIVLPKANGQADVEAVDALLTQYEAGDTKGATGLITIATENADSVLSLARDRISHPRLKGMMWGAEDLAADIGASANYVDGQFTEPFRLARNLCLLAARAANVIPIDTIYADFRDESGLCQQSLEACRDGFLAKAAIHPAQLEVIKSAFTPTEEQASWARNVVQAFADADTGVASLDGKMLDMPHLRMAQNILHRLGS